MNLLIIIAAGVMIAIALMVIAIYADAYTLATIIAWITGAMLIFMAKILLAQAAWKIPGVIAGFGGVIVIISGIIIFIWSRKQKR